MIQQRLKLKQATLLLTAFEDEVNLAYTNVVRLTRGETESQFELKILDQVSVKVKDF